MTMVPNKEKPARKDLRHQVRGISPPQDSWVGDVVFLRKKI